MWGRQSRTLWWNGVLVLSFGVRSFAQTEPLVAVPVIVRDLAGNPVSGLQASQFTVRSQGETLPVVRILRSGTWLPSYASTGERASTDPASTKLLVLLPPMAPASLHFATRSVRAGIDQMVQCCDVTLFLPDGTETPFTRDPSVLESAVARIGHGHSKMQNPVVWVQMAQSAVVRLSALPGRHVILFANAAWAAGTDRLSNFSPYVSPTNFLSAALASQSSLYSVQTDGPRPVIPFGGASGVQDGLQGSGMLQSLSHALSRDAQLQGETLQLGDLTGGIPVISFRAGADAIARDNRGYYLLLLRPPANMEDDSWHTISVTVNVPHTEAWWGHYYYASSRAELAVPGALLADANQPVSRSGPGSIAIQEWFFPDGLRDSTYTLPFAVRVVNPAPVEMFIRLLDLRLNLPLGAWYSQSTADADGMLHRQFESSVGPGTYRIDVVTRNLASHRMDHATSVFAVRSVAGQPFAVSSPVLYDICEAPPPGQRKRLDDPIQVNGCIARLALQKHFSRHASVRLLLRIYPESDKEAARLRAGWDGKLLIDEHPLPKENSALPLQMGTPRGLVIDEPIDLAANGIGPGSHHLQIVMTYRHKQIVLASAPLVVSGP